MTVDEFFSGIPLGVKVYERVGALLRESGHEFTTRVSKSQVALRRKKGFAYLWRPGQHLSNPKADVVLSIALPRHVKSARFKEVAHPARTVWMHHLELHGAKDVDGEVAGWLREAADAAD